VGCALPARHGRIFFATTALKKDDGVPPGSATPRQIRRLGIIGSGFMGAAHIDGLRRVPGVNVVAISSIDFCPRLRTARNACASNSSSWPTVTISERLSESSKSKRVWQPK
jgi:predicted homoserine dehydrogenase-like protein